MTPEEYSRAVTFVETAFQHFLGAGATGRQAALKSGLADGKLYELAVLGWLIPRVANGLTPTLENGPAWVLRRKPGRVDRGQPHIALRRPDDSVAAEIWSNVEVVGIGYERSGRRSAALLPLEPDFHELDIAVLGGGAAGLVARQMVHVAVECKDRPINKAILRELLGLRRELSYFTAMPATVPEVLVQGYPPPRAQRPPSQLFLCSSRPLPRNHDQVAEDYSIHVLHLPF